MSTALGRILPWEFIDSEMCLTLLQFDFQQPALKLRERGLRGPWQLINRRVFKQLQQSIERLLPPVLCGCSATAVCAPAVPEPNIP